MFRPVIYWRSIIAGVVTAMAVAIIMTLFGSALGFAVIDPMSSNPFSGLGTTFSIWSIVTILLSLAAGGFVAGLFGGGRGLEHGFLTWATLLLIGTILSGLAIGAAASAVGTAAKSLGTGVASVASTVGSGIGSVATQVVDTIQENVDLDFSARELGDEVASVLQDTGIETLQPSYLRQQMRGTRSDLRTAATRLAMDADNYDVIIGDFIDRQQARLDAITSDIDRESAITAVMRTRNVNRTQAAQMVDNAISTYNEAIDNAQDAIAGVQQQLTDVRQYLAGLAHEARIEADELASTATKSALMAGVALLIGAVVASLAGMLGNRYWHRYYYTGEAILDETVVTARLDRSPV